MLSIILYLCCIPTLYNNVKAWYTLSAEERYCRVTLKRFPSYLECEDQIDVGKRHLILLRERRWLYIGDNRRDLDYYIAQIERWIEFWDCLYKLQAVVSCADQTTFKLGQLRYIRTVLGEIWFQQGYVPPPIAPWLYESGNLKSE